MKQFDRILRTLHECVVDLALRKHRAHGNRAVRQSLRSRDQVRRHVEGLRSKRFSDPAEACDHFVEYQQDLVLVADFPQTLQVPHRRQYHAGGA
jgi:hypothetical protein